MKYMTVAQLKAELTKYPDDAVWYGQEGEITIHEDTDDFDMLGTIQASVVEE